MGDPAGIGPEIVIKALAERCGRDRGYRLLTIGNGASLKEIASKFGISVRFDIASRFEEVAFEPDAISVLDIAEFDRQDFRRGEAHAGAGDLVYRIVTKAVSLAVKKKIAAIVTAPICKESLHLAGHRFNGHTDLIAKLTDTADYRMMFSAPRLKILHVTAHLPLLEACRTITAEMVYRTIRLGSLHMARLGIPSPKIAVCGLNPHAGEGGFIGREDLDIISPAVDRAKSEGMAAIGPLPADTLFLRAYRGEFDLAIAQYHDQGHAPGKLVAFDTAVNVTVGLPIVRTSVDHGTAFDIVERGIAKFENLNCAIDYAARLLPGQVGGTSQDCLE